MLKTSAQRGFSYVEILLSVVLLAMLLVPALEALQTGITGTQSAAQLARHQALRDKMELVLSKPFADLYAQTYLPGANTGDWVSASLSDPAGAPNQRNVVLYRYDATTRALSSADTGLLYVAVFYQGQSGDAGLSTLVGRWW